MQRLREGQSCRFRGGILGDQRVEGLSIEWTGEQPKSASDSRKEQCRGTACSGANLFDRCPSWCTRDFEVNLEVGYCLTCRSHRICVEDNPRCPITETSNTSGLSTRGTSDLSTSGASRITASCASYLNTASGSRCTSSVIQSRCRGTFPGRGCSCRASRQRQV